MFQTHWERVLQHMLHHRKLSLKQLYWEKNNTFLPTISCQTFQMLVPNIFVLKIGKGDSCSRCSQKKCIAYLAVASLHLSWSRWSNVVCHSQIVGDLTKGWWVFFRKTIAESNYLCTSEISSTAFCVVRLVICLALCCHLAVKLYFTAS